MAENPPVVYLLHGEDVVAITQFVDTLVGKLGDPAFASLNTVKLDGRTATLEEIETAAGTLPFMVKRRMVILTNPLARLTNQTARQKFTSLLERLSSSAALILIEHQLLTDDRERKKGHSHWLESWAGKAGDRVFVRAFPVPRGPAFFRRLQEQARLHGGELTLPAAELLASLVGENLLDADQEIHKLLAYVNYQRPVEIEDVDHLTTDRGQGDIFAMVDAIGNRNGKVALDMLHRLLSEQDALSIFGMIIRQFRLLLQAREILDAGGRPSEVAHALKIHPFVAEKVYTQARQFSLPVLERVYHRLLELDLAMKTGEIEGDIALDTLIAGFTS